MDNKILSEGLKLRLYVPKFNKRNWGVIYANLNLNAKRIRISTGIKVKETYWDNKRGCINLVNGIVGLTDREIHKKAYEMLNNVIEVVDYKVCCIFENKFIDLQAFKKDIVNALQTNLTMTKKKKQSTFIPTSLTQMIEALIIENYTNVKSRQTRLGQLSNFKTFMQSVKLKDNIETLNTTTLRAYRDYLVNSSRSAERSKQCLSFMFFIANTIKQKWGFKIDLDKDAISPISDKRTNKDKSKNAVALTHDEIDAIKRLELYDTEKEVRDLFLIQCYSGCRFEDLNKLLESDNLQIHEGVKYSVFTTEKKRTTAFVPLEGNYKDLWPLWDIYKNTRVPSHTTFNNGIKKIAEKAALNRPIERTQTRRNALVINKIPLHQCISSHTARHSFITNSRRYFNMKLEDISKITGHATLSMVEHYTNFSDEDNLTALNKVIHGNNNNNENNNNNIGNEHLIPNRENNYLISGIEEAKNVLKFMCVEFNGNETFNDLINKIEMEQAVLKNEFGIDVILIKPIFNVSLPLYIRVELLKGIKETIFSRLKV